MKRTFLIAITFMVALLTANSAWAGTHTINIYPTKDGYFRSGNTTNFAQAGLVGVSTSANVTSNTWLALVGFDLSSVKTWTDKGFTVKSATLRFTKNQVQKASTLNISGYSDNSWTEAAWSSANVSNTHVGSSTLASTTVGTANSFNFGETKTTTRYGNIADLQFTVTSTDLTTYVSSAVSSGNVSFSLNIGETTQNCNLWDREPEKITAKYNEFTWNGSSWTKGTVSNAISRYENTKLFYMTEAFADEEAFKNELRPMLSIEIEMPHAKNTNTGTTYESIVTAVLEATANDVIELYEDEVLDARWEITNAVTIKAAEGTSPVIKRGSFDKSHCLAWFNNASGELIIDGITFDNNNTTTTGHMFEGGGNMKGTVKLNNVTFQNSNSKSGLYLRNIGTYEFTNVTFKNIQSTDYATLYTLRDALTLDGNIIFENCNKSICFGGAQNKGFKQGDNLVFTPSVVDIYFSDDRESGRTIVQNKSSLINAFDIRNDGWYIEKGTASLVAKKVTDSYSLAVTAAGVATLVLPYEATIPEGVKAYTLTYSEPNTLNATLVTGTLSAHTPVHVVANEGSYTFSATTGSTADYSNGSPTSGCLVGAYKTTKVESGNYILYKPEGGEAGYYQSRGNFTVGAFHAYLTLGSGGSSAKELKIIYNDNATTGITTVDERTNRSNISYNLNGQRVNASHKGIIIVNGKKYINK